MIHYEVSLMVFVDADSLGLRTAARDSNLNNLAEYCVRLG